MNEKAKFYERHASILLEEASFELKKEYPNYGDVDRAITKAQDALKYARQCNNGTFKGEEW